MAKSFFTGIATHKKGRRQVSDDTLHAAQCRVCPLNTDLGKLEPRGPEEALAYVLREAPNAVEERTRMGFYGEASKYLEECLEGLEYRMWYTVRCCPPDGEAPSRIATECCRPYVEADLELVRPMKVLLVGRSAFRWVTGSNRLTKFANEWLPMRQPKFSTWCLAIPSPDDALVDDNAMVVFNQGIDLFIAGPPRSCGYRVSDFVRLKRLGY